MRRVTTFAIIVALWSVPERLPAGAQVEEARIRKDFAAALAPPCWQPVVATNGMAGGMGSGSGPSMVKPPWEAPATLNAARHFAQQHRERAIPALKELARGGTDFAQKGFAVATLAALADHPAGADALVEFVFDPTSAWAQDMVFSLLADLHGDGARPIVERLYADALDRLLSTHPSSSRGNVAGVQTRAGILLSALGNESTRALYQSLRDRTGTPVVAKNSVETALSALDARLALPAAERAPWSRDAIEFMKVGALHSGHISAEVGANRAAAALKARGVRLGVPFLRMKLHPVASDIAIAVAGTQRETKLIPDLVLVIERPDAGYTASMAVGALGEIGSRDALDALLDFVRPDFRMRIAVPLSLLANRGDATTLQDLKRLATAPSFSIADRADIVIARDYLAARLAAKVATPAMGGAPQFPIR